MELNAQKTIKYMKKCKNIDLSLRQIKKVFNSIGIIQNYFKKIKNRRFRLSSFEGAYYSVDIMDNKYLN